MYRVSRCVHLLRACTNIMQTRVLPRLYSRSLPGSLTDDTLFPPPCCKQPITFGGGVRVHFTSALVRSFESKMIEFDTPDRTYCSDQLCSAFIGIENIFGGESHLLRVLHHYLHSLQVRISPGGLPCRCWTSASPCSS